MTRYFLRVSIIGAAIAATLCAQFGGGAATAGQGTQPVQVPLSGRPGNAGSVATAQTPVPGATTSVNTINSTLQVTGPYSGSRPPGNAPQFQGRLSLADAVQRALAANLGAVNASLSVRSAKAQERVAKSPLLPQVNGYMRENVVQNDLQAFGFNFSFPGVQIGPVVGPFGYFDFRASVQQSVVDLTAINNYRAAKESVKANAAGMDDARDLIILAAGGIYLQALAAKARVALALAQIETAKTIADQTLQRRQAGVAAQIDVNRARVQEQTQRQRLVTVQNDLARQKITLARITGLPVNADYELADDLLFTPPPAVTADAALRVALESRADLRQASVQIRVAEKGLAAARASRLPSLSASADYGAIGPGFRETEGTFNFTANLRIPIWQGGKAAADREAAETALEQRKAELADLKGRIESEIRNAFLDMDAAASQIELARDNQAVAAETLKLAQEKLSEGVTDTVEVTQAEEAVAAAGLDYITGLFAHNLAKLNLARATGQIEQNLATYLQVKPN
jgi:outer membrane protein TolC